MPLRHHNTPIRMINRDRPYPIWTKRYADYKVADNYAWYATANYFSQWWGIPNPSFNSVDVEDFMDDSVDDDSKPTNVIPNIFEHPDWDDISTDEGIAFAAGDYTPNGWVQGKNLRILPLGDSITNGFRSSDGNGYREDLETILVNANNRVQMVGSLRSGTMAQNENEGHNGATIAQIATYTSAYDRRPNVVLLHAGTNDLNTPLEPSTAPQRLDSLVGQLVTALPDAIIIVARIVPSTNAGTSTMIPQFDYAITDLMATRVQNGQHIVMVDMPSGVTTADLSDGLHPNDEGYNKMAIKWAIALTAANDRGWIREPVPGQGGGLTTCPHDPIWIPQGEIANGAGLGPDLFLTVWCTSNPISGLCDCQSPRTETALTRELLDWKNICEIRSLAFPLVAAVHFADLNGDGRAEFIYVGDSGDLTVFLNLGAPDNGPNAAKVQWLPSGEIGQGINFPRRNVQFADLNGDGRAEYLQVNDDGSIEAWLNLGGPDNGPNAAKVRWLEQGTIASGIGKDGRGVRFADLNGDGRAEYLYVHTDGSVEAYLNLGGLDGTESNAKVGWLPQGVIATGVGLGRDNVIFADINGDGRADYIAVDRTVGSAQVWLNGGGPDNGPNAAKVVWYPHGTIATGVGGFARGLQFADLNGDGRAEYVDVAFDTSAVRAWLNGC
ncbi:unnamed protein product [Penicillium salamii]|nr:unnamed protein product [Penicillium salamii]CAG8428243.1 unnamed protein product [Penicillium salamii]